MPPSPTPLPQQEGLTRSQAGAPEARCEPRWNMSSLGGRRRPQVPPKVVTSVIDGLKAIYFQKVGRCGRFDRRSLSLNAQRLS
jgi:hypothetical protein